MIDLYDKKQRERVLRAVKSSREALEPFRKTRIEMIKDYVGSWYSERGARNEVLVNLLNQMARIYSRFLAANNPRVKVVAKHPKGLPFAKRYEINLNKKIVDMELDQTFRLIILDAFFLMGVAKVTMTDSGIGVQESEDVWYDVGEPWVERISADDLILDMTAKEITKMRFCGDRYRVPFDKVVDEPTYDPAVLKKLVPTSKHSYEAGSDMARDIAAGDAIDDDELEPMITLMDLWIPNRGRQAGGRVFTLACDTDLEPLNEREHSGTQSGPYKFLSLGFVPDNVIPSSPSSNLKGLHDKINASARKLRLQTRMLKENPVYPPGGEEDAERLMNAPYGRYVKSRNPKDIVVVKQGGPDQGLMAAQLADIDLFDRLGGNLRGAAGLGAQASTVGQEEIIQGQLAGQQADLQFQVVKFAGEVCGELGALMWNDNFMEIESTMEVGTMGETVDASWRPELREGRLDQYDFAVEPYSMVYKTPQQKLQEIFSVMREIAPLWPMFQASGVSLDVVAYLDEIQDLLDQPAFKRFFTAAFPSDQLGGDQNTIRQSPVTSRETVRRNIPTGGTAENRSAVLQQALMGGGQNTPQQMASLTRAPA